MSSKKIKTEKLDLKNIREKLSQRSGPQYWRSLEEIAETDGFRDFLKHEFPKNADIWPDGLERRHFLQLMGASLALVGFTGCTQQPEERIVPFVKAPEELIPGKPLFYATAMPFYGYAQGLLAESHDGRPTKVEGNPRHPASQGATNLFAQASVLDLYDPDRIDVIMQGGRVRTWERFVAELTSEIERQRSTGGKGFCLLTETVTSPTLAAQISQLLERLPEARWVQYEPISLDSLRAGALQAFGEPLNTVYRFDKADVVLSLDADFMSSGPAAVRYARDFSARRKVESNGTQPNRFYMIESAPTVTATLADNRLAVRPSQVEKLAIQLAVELGIETGRPSGLTPDESAFVAAAAKDLKSATGKSLVVAGEYLSASIHALVHLINERLENHGQTVVQTEPVEFKPEKQLDALRVLVEDMNSGQVETLLIFGGNPVFDTPSDLDFASALNNVSVKAHLTRVANETSKLCNWQVPESHYLEAWGDLRAFDGTVSIVQPLIEPIFRSKSGIEVLGALLGSGTDSGYGIVRSYWQSQSQAADFEKDWRRWLHDGIIPDTAAPIRTAEVQQAAVLELLDGGSAAGTGLELIFRPDPSIFDGRYINNGWLQEVPKALTKLTWDNAVLVSPATATEQSLQNGDLVKVKSAGAEITAPIWIQPAHPKGAVTIHLGYGRRETGSVGRGTGFDAYPARTSTGFWMQSGIELEKTGESYDLACTQQHSSMEGRNLIRTATAQAYAADPEVISEMGFVPTGHEAMYPPFEYAGNAWGMAVDLNSCIGCNACVVACQAENNIAVVGKDQVMNGREMHWIRIDRYYEGSIDNPQTLHQPVMCQHCENAPCESVCPVAATVHSDEGLNDMVYNRCVGTRYCSNNCPYKVRRFNFLLYSDWQTETLKLQRNPNVTVRSRGVMEKCTYCVQRINSARIQSTLEDRSIRDGDIRTACEQVCPTDAIVFGNINDPDSRVAKLKESQRNYGILMEVNTRPRTSYLAKITNPNDEIGEEA